MSFVRMKLGLFLPISGRSGGRAFGKFQSNDGHFFRHEVVKALCCLAGNLQIIGERTKRMSELPRVALIITGGTIDSVGKDRLDLAWYIEAGKRLNTGELLEQIPELKGIARVEEVPFRRLPSHGLVDKDWLDLVRAIHSIFDENRADGIVITPGNNTIEETAYFLNLTLKTDKPAVLVGSMRPSSAISADGYLNVLNAVRVAADPNARGRGALLVMNDTIFRGRDVTKTATYHVQAFQARDLGPLGYADADGKVIYFHQTTKRHTVNTEFDVRK